MADKQWTMYCILAGAEVAHLVREDKLQQATEYLTNLTSELTATDIEYLLTRVRDMLAKEGGENNER